MVIEVFGSLFCFFLSGSQAPAAGSRGGGGVLSY